jgi:hypothetical protein
VTYRRGNEQGFRGDVVANEKEQVRVVENLKQLVECEGERAEPPDPSNVGLDDGCSVGQGSDGDGVCGAVDDGDHSVRRSGLVVEGDQCVFEVAGVVARGNDRNDEPEVRDRRPAG